MASSIKQWVSTLSGIDSLQKVDAPMPVPGKGEVLVRINAVSLNYRDVEVIHGEYTHHRSLEKIKHVVPCSDMCGSIVQVGTGTGKWKAGDRVISTFLPDHLTGPVREEYVARGMGLPLDGVLATHRVFGEEALVAAPEYMTDEEACTLPIASVTAWMGINGMRPIGEWGGKGECVLSLGTGGVAIAGLQIAKAAGAKTIITSSSDEKLAQARALGADHTINYRTTPNWETEVLSHSSPSSHGADIILETGGAQTLRKSLECIAFNGTINCIGYVSGKYDEPTTGQDMDARLNMNLLMLRRSATLKGIINGPRDRFEEALRFYEIHRIRPVVGRVFGFEEAGEAFQFVRDGSHFGKVVIKV